MVKPEIRIFSDISRMAEYLIQVTGEIFTSKIPGSYLNIALSGGNTPKFLFEQWSLNHSDRLKQFPLRFFQVDERCVPPDHSESNFRMIHESLLHGLEIPDHLIFRIKGENDPEKEAIRYSEVLAKTLPEESGWPVFDIMLLGLGSDGHTASIFPQDEKVLRSEKRCETATHPQSGQKRITLTLPVINHSAHQVFLVTGKDKASIVVEILQGSGKEPFPATLVNPVKGRQTWLLDQPAASLLLLTDPTGVFPADHKKGC